jgi:hypothetical protein
MGYEDYEVYREHTKNLRLHSNTDLFNNLSVSCESLVFTIRNILSVNKKKEAKLCQSFTNICFKFRRKWYCRIIPILTLNKYFNFNFLLHIYYKNNYLFIY